VNEILLLLLGVTAAVAAMTFAISRMTTAPEAV
jgi:hypothetical protein